MENQGLSGVHMKRTNIIKRKTPYPQKREKTKTNDFEILVEIIQGVEEKNL